MNRKTGAGIAYIILLRLKNLQDVKGKATIMIRKIQISDHQKGKISRVLYAVILVLIVVSCILVSVIVFQPLLSSPETGITVSYTDSRYNETFDPGATSFFEGTPMVFKFKNLEIDAVYTLYRIDFDIYTPDTYSELVIEFTNVTEKILVLSLKWEHFYLYRDDLPVLFIECIPQPVYG